MASLSITAKELIRLLTLDGWVETRWTLHGLGMAKRFPDGRIKVTVIPRRGVLPPGTLAAILGTKQTGLGRTGLEALIRKYGR